MDEVPQEDLHSRFVNDIAKPVIATLLQKTQAGEALSKEAASCLAGLIRKFGSPTQEGEQIL